MSFSSKTMATIAVTMTGTINEILAFLTLSLLLQMGLASRFIIPWISAKTQLGEVQEIYALFGMEFFLVFYLVPAVIGLFNASNFTNRANGGSGDDKGTLVKKSSYCLRIEKLSSDMLNGFMMLLSALFLATVTKVPALVRLELVAVQLVSIFTFFLARIFTLEVLELYAIAISRQSCISLVGYAVIPNFDTSFSGLVKACANFTANYARYAKSALPF